MTEYNVTVRIDGRKYGLTYRPAEGEVVAEVAEAISETVALTILNHHESDSERPDRQPYANRPKGLRYA